AHHSVGCGVCNRGRRARRRSAVARNGTQRVLRGRSVTISRVTQQLVDVVRSATRARDVPDELGPLLAERITRARTVWPNARVDEEQFVRAIGQRLAADAPVRSLEAMQTDDLYLACGCAAGDRGALDGFEECCGAVIARAIASTGVAASDRADL